MCSGTPITSNSSSFYLPGNYEARSPGAQEPGQPAAPVMLPWPRLLTGHETAARRGAHLAVRGDTGTATVAVGEAAGITARLGGQHTGGGARPLPRSWVSAS